MKVTHRIEVTKEELNVVVDFATSQRHNYGFELIETFQSIRDPKIYIFEFGKLEEKDSL